MDFEIIASELNFPEGPVFMQDGTIVLVEIASGDVTRILGSGKREVIAHTGGGPNGAAIGPDGALYICNNGGFEWSETAGIKVPGHAPADYSGGRIERIDLGTGEITRLYDEVGGNPLKGPNDIVFDKQGNFYFTDHGKTYPRHRDLGGLFYASPDGKMVKELDWGHTSPNGVGLSPDEKTVYMADTLTGRLWAYDLSAPGEVAPASPLQRGRVVAAMPGLQYFDSLAVTAAGNICVATIFNGGITTIKPDGSHYHTPFPDLLCTNIVFGGDDLQDAWITLSGTGVLAKKRWDEPGLKLNYNG